MNKTKMGFTVYVLMARRAVHVLALVFFKGLRSYFLLATVSKATATKAHGGLWVGHGFARVVLAEMCLETSLSEKVPMTTGATLCGFLASRVNMKKIRAALFGSRTGNGLFVWCIDDVPRYCRVSNSGHIHNWTRKSLVNG